MESAEIDIKIWLTWGGGGVCVLVCVCWGGWHYDGPKVTHIPPLGASV